MRKSLLLVPALWLASSAGAATISLVPSLDTATVGDVLELDLMVDGLGDGEAPSLGVFDLDVSYDPLVLGLTDVNLGDGLSVSLPTHSVIDGGTPGVVSLLEVSFESVATLDALQASAFRLATLSFEAVEAGDAGLALQIRSLGDASGDPLRFETDVAGLGVAPPIPEPASVASYALGVAVVVAGARRARRR
jgi:hypothetical protein